MWNFNVICQYFKCEAHIGTFHCSNSLELIVIQTRKQLSGKYFQFFMTVLSNFSSK